uniref:Uncharacterized protein n=1 Tax=Manihot esculenta TaxID=3983 RepID=A0A2C9U2F3_MANES
MLVWHHGFAIQPCKCPLCLRQITLLVPGETSQRERHNPEVAEILQKVQAYNHLFGGQTIVGVFGIVFFLGQLVMKLRVISNTRMQDLPFLLKRLLRETMDPQRSLPLVIRARVYIAVK